MVSSLLSSSFLKFVSLVSFSSLTLLSSFCISLFCFSKELLKSLKVFSTLVFWLPPPPGR
ncbi:hypothetical protein MSU_0558 [Mycoplasma suis str. Illinois]|uniref:Uncharacterized protein n=1 Tax=Mycoplasma suis (strain Illinois) TaxID=768700 RepID=F0QRH1_MYCSL|nr:hypothetical protein MSU_0558 [Mycoplasma suis str. Illinois]